VVSALATVWGLLSNRVPSASTRGIGQLASLRIDMNKVNRLTGHHPECGGWMTSVSSTSPLHGACQILVDGTKISAELNNL
jgi:hypothetical protein